MHHTLSWAGSNICSIIMFLRREQGPICMPNMVHLIKKNNYSKSKKVIFEIYWNSIESMLINNQVQFMRLFSSFSWLGARKRRCPLTSKVLPPTVRASHRRPIFRLRSRTWWCKPTKFNLVTAVINCHWLAWIFVMYTLLSICLIICLIVCLFLRCIVLLVLDILYIVAYL